MGEVDLMAQFRQVYVRVWREDDWFQELSPDAKLIWLCLLTNPSTNQAGIYRITVTTISNDTKIALDKVKEVLANFADDGKIMFANGVLWVKRMREYQTGEEVGRRLSPQQIAGIANDLKEIPDGAVKQAYMEHYGKTPKPEFGELDAKDCNTFDLVRKYVEQDKRGPTEPGYNKAAAVGTFMVARFGDNYAPNFAWINRMANKLSGGHIALAEMIRNCAAPAGDPHVYLEGIISRAPNRTRANAQPEQPTARPVNPQLEAIRRINAERAAHSNGNGTHAD